MNEEKGGGTEEFEGGEEQDDTREPQKMAFESLEVTLA
eukprot:CAMPEP_0184343932 /NCGR_PEP_ID=MMETSP1089-20130417/12444_1 /TAXON_ID=38269 ORGANISM="Gloeochaete wittrockiana, Strain SAG46.84" /NCGR_SAMPLE_ID=MMETSP1089 /ASSEMBLY_ACC=CAM_ASM_000445 /LENGTH=37 /DNA_ID= /DNA_START= /DNA_END= /DNA_ORIENTATION=